MKKNIGAQLALYPAPVIVVGAIVNDKPTWTLVAHAGTMAHSHLMVSLVHAHYINQEIIESKKLSVNIVDGAWLKEADRMGVISGNKEDKSESGKIDYHTFKPVLFEFPTYEYFVTGEKVGRLCKDELEVFIPGRLCYHDSMSESERMEVSCRRDQKKERMREKKRSSMHAKCCIRR